MQARYFFWLILLLLGVTLLSGCAYRSAITFPSANDVFMTEGDGDIQKPYTPIGVLIYYKTGYRIALPLLGLIPIGDPDPEYVLREEIARKVKSMGGDGVIQLSIGWIPGKSGFLGLLAQPGKLLVQGQVIKR